MHKLEIYDEIIYQLPNQEPLLCVIADIRDTRSGDKKYTLSSCRGVIENADIRHIKPFSRKPSWKMIEEVAKWKPQGISVEQ